MKTFTNENTNNLIKNMSLSALIGILVGVLIFVFKYGAEFVYDLSDYIFTAVKNTPSYLPLLIIGVLLLSTLSYLLLKGVPFARGGGIPVAEGLVRNKITFNPFKVGSRAFFSSYVSFFSGLPLGSEGPSVLLGACVGKSFSGFLKNKKDNSLIKAGAACAFSAVTGAPIAGVFFIEEEMHDGIYLKKVLCVITAIIFSCASSFLLCYAFNKDFAMFGYDLVVRIPLKYYFLSIICGLTSGILSYLFVKLFTSINRFSIKKLKDVPLYIKITLCFLVCALIAVYVDGARGSGHHLIENIENVGFNTKLLLTILVFKLIMLLLVGGSGATGGMFIPMLAVGAIIGGVLGDCAISFGLPISVYPALVGAVTVAFLSGTQHSPFTALFFSIEAMGGILNAPFTLISVIISFLIVKLLKGKPIYDELFKNMLNK